MRQSILFYKTNKDIKEEEKIAGLHFLIQGDYIDKLASGIYSYLPLGWKVLHKLENLIRQEMTNIKAQEVLLPALQPKEIWEKTGRWDNIEPPLFKLQDQHKKELTLGPTHEEVMTKLIKDRIQSYKDLPVALFQIQTKFRNEVRATGGLLRTRELLMKDLYSFHQTKEDLASYYKKVTEAYQRIFSQLKLDALKVDALSGSIGGDSSHEFMVPSEVGEDQVYYCPKCKTGYSAEYLENQTKVNLKTCSKCGSKLEKKPVIESGHIFILGENYSSSFQATYLDKNGNKKPILMGCYGIGVGRLLATIVTVHHDDRGIIWPSKVAPFDIHLLNLNLEGKEREKLEKLYNQLLKKGQDVLYDDRTNIHAGEKLIEADLIGTPLRVIGSKKTIADNKLEVKERCQKKTELVDINQFLSSL
jgi:prolyl-tRNA synthetase